MFETVNYAEAGLWGVIGICFLIVAMAVPRNRGRCFVIGVTFLAFGGSDIVEVQTGAWWQPWWLLLWKGVCVLVMLQQLVHHLRRRTPS